MADLYEHRREEDRREDERAGEITEIHRHRDRVAAGFTQRGRGDFRQPERGGDGRNFAERRGIVLHKVCSGTARQGQDPE